MAFQFMRQDLPDVQLMDMFDRRLKSFHQDHIIRMNNLLSDERPNISLVIGYCLSGGKPRLFHSIESVISEEPEKCSVGVGQHYADAMLDRYWFKNMKMESGIVLAAYVISRVKEAVHGCGNLTHIICMGNGHTRRVKQEDIEKIEKVLGDHIDNGNLMLQFVAGFPLSENEIHKKVKSFGDGLLRFRNRMTTIQNKLKLENVERGVRQLDRQSFRLV